MTTIKLKTPATIGGKEVKELKFDLNKLTGLDMIKAEQDARDKGDKTPMISLSLQYQIALAARLLSCPVEDLEALNASDFTSLTNEVFSFLFG